jgi:hypothetical protein
MSRISRAISSLVKPFDLALRRHFPQGEVYEGGAGTTWFFGLESRAPSIAAYFSGHDVSRSHRSRVPRTRIPRRIDEVAAAGGLPILRLPEPDPWFDDVLQRAIAVPNLVDIHRDLPADVETLRDQLLTSTTREDFRRIRRANFSYRVTSDPDMIQEFHARHYTPLLAHRFPDDGRIAPLKNMLRAGGELICADIEGDWVAGVFNIPREEAYAMTALGVRDADEAVRHKRVAAALIIRSLERAVELGVDRATLGRSLPFLGKGPVWFKAKWGATITRGPRSRELHMFMDLRQAAVRQMLSASPIIHVVDDALVASTWLEPGDEMLRVAVREADRFAGISKWYVLGLPETLAAGAAELSTSERIIPVPVVPSADQPLWLGEVLSATELGNRHADSAGVSAEASRTLDS